MEHIIAIFIFYVLCVAIAFSISRRDMGAIYSGVPGDNWTSRLQRRLSFPLGWFYPVAALQIAYRRQIDGRWRPGRLWIGWGTVEAGEHEERLFRNGVFFARVALPGCIALGVRWGADSARKSHLDFVFGWRPNGVPGASFRIQSDASSAAGYDIPNPGQAQGFSDGWR